MRRPAPATIIATVALVLAAAPAGSAADHWIARALYARDAGTVDGFKASRSPKQGRLIVLPKSGKLPASILPPPVPGAAAAAPGAAGAPVTASGSAAFVANAAAAVTLTSAQTSVVSLALKAGTYAVVAKGSLHAQDISSPQVTCQLKAGSDGDQVDVDLSGSTDAPVALVTTHTFAAAGTVTLTCAADDVGVVVSDAHLLALKVDSVNQG
ncbi:MAG: hypothetical protein QOK36_3304 [Gaiellales bacterium]|jgi:hypothetical protein|nr:hypothetical protein [Gaiellales bacterium]